MENIFKRFINLSLTLSAMAGLSFSAYRLCEEYGCDSWTSFLGADIICNTCVDMKYHLKNFQISLYGSIFTLITYQLSSLIKRAGAPSETYIFQDYKLGKNSPKPRNSNFTQQDYREEQAQ